MSTLRLMSSHSPSKILGGMWFIEAVTQPQYVLICNALKKFKAQNGTEFDQDSLIFWLEHIEHDPNHIKDTISAAESLEDGFSVCEFESGAYQSFLLERVFWDGIYQKNELLF